jgi:Na+/H+ antiporter NhaD/arsenite permease-like protein
MFKILCLIYTLSVVLVPETAQAAEGAPGIPGTELTILWTIPFVCMLLSIAVLPLVLPRLWEHHYGKIAMFWGIAFLLPCAFIFGYKTALYEFLHIIVLDYIPFIILLFSLFVIAGGVRLTGSLSGTPVSNTGLLALGTFLASVMGTTGAAMLLIRPLLHSNAHRKHKVHMVIFFIFLVANIGGSLTPLGDPPLFLGFLKGVSFFWPTVHLFLKTTLMVFCLLGIFFTLDTVLFNKERQCYAEEQLTHPKEKIGLEGKINLILLLGVVLVVLMSGVMKLGVVFEMQGIAIEGQNLLRDGLLLCLAGLSLKLTPWVCRKRNNFSWEPIKEVAKLFLGIFISMIPALAILKAGADGSMASLIRVVSDNGTPNNAIYFWLTGILSSFLDNAPTYMVFFNTAGGDANYLMHEMPQTLAAISAGAVFMGANTYIGNAPNFMVRSIAENSGIKMPSFFGYMLWSAGILIPLFILVTFIFF